MSKTIALINPGRTFLIEWGGTATFSLSSVIFDKESSWVEVESMWSTHDDGTYLTLTEAVEYMQGQLNEIDAMLDGNEEAE